MIEGVYALEQWWIGGVVHVPPQVEGRFILREGTVLAFIHNRTTTAPRYSGTLFGNYRLDANTFAYGYHDALMVSHSTDGVGVGEQVPWQGMREFAVETRDDAIFVRSQGGAEEFRFAAGGFLYSENGQPMRQWRRLDAAGN